jgi:hypothetical protein
MKSFEGGKASSSGTTRPNEDSYSGIHALPRPVGEQRQRQEPRVVGAVLAVQVAEVEHDRLVAAADLVVAEVRGEEGRVVEVGGELPRGFAGGDELGPGRRQRGEHLVEEVVLPAAVRFAAGRLHGWWDSRQRLAGRTRAARGGGKVLCRREEGVSLPAKYNSSAAPPANYSSALVQVGIRSRMCKRKRSFSFSVTVFCLYFCFSSLVVYVTRPDGGLCQAEKDSAQQQETSGCFTTPQANNPSVFLLLSFRTQNMY